MDDVLLKAGEVPSASKRRVAGPEALGLCTRLHLRQRVPSALIRRLGLNPFVREGCKRTPVTRGFERDCPEEEGQCLTLPLPEEIPESYPCKAFADGNSARYSGARRNMRAQKYAFPHLCQQL